MVLLQTMYIRSSHRDLSNLAENIWYVHYNDRYIASGRAWYIKIDHDLLTRGLKRTSPDPTVYLKRTGSRFLILVLYVDNLLITGYDVSGSAVLKREQLHTLYEMTDLGLMHKFLGVQCIKQEPTIYFIKQIRLHQY